MLNELACPDLYDKAELHKYRQWENEQLENFGFMKDDKGNWKENPLYSGDKLIAQNPDDKSVSLHVAAPKESSPLIV